MLQHLLSSINITLASQSPRRQELLKGLDIDFTIETRPLEEVYDSQLQGKQITEYLSKLKAQPFEHDLNDHQLVITSDTIVWLEQQALMKPSNSQDAIDMLQAISGKEHQVFTSVTFTTKQLQETITDETKVLFKDLDLDQIKYYVQNYKPFDRAGAYGIQDWLGYTGIQKIEGCYYNVMGLPLPKVYQWLSKFAQSL